MFTKRQQSRCSYLFTTISPELTITLSFSLLFAVVLSLPQSEVYTHGNFDASDKSRSQQGECHSPHLVLFLFLLSHFCSAATSVSFTVPVHNELIITVTRLLDRWAPITIAIVCVVIPRFLFVSRKSNVVCKPIFAFNVFVLLSSLPSICASLPVSPAVTVNESVGVTTPHRLQSAILWGRPLRSAERSLPNGPSSSMLKTSTFTTKRQTELTTGDASSPKTHQHIISFLTQPPYFGLLLAVFTALVVFLVIVLVFWCSNHRPTAVVGGKSTTGSDDSKVTTTCQSGANWSATSTSADKPDFITEWSLLDCSPPTSFSRPIQGAPTDAKEEGNGDMGGICGDKAPMSPPPGLSKSSFLCADCCRSYGEPQLPEGSVDKMITLAVRIPEHTSPMVRSADPAVVLSSTAAPASGGLASRRIQRQATPVPQILTPTTSLQSVVELRTVTVQPSAISAFSLSPSNTGACPLTSPGVAGAVGIPSLSSVMSSSMSSPTSSLAVSPKSQQATEYFVPQTQTLTTPQNVTSATPMTRRRNRGLLESRRGSHTSLTLPSFPVDIVSHASSSCSVSAGGPRTGSLDEATGITDVPPPHTTQGTPNGYSLFLPCSSNNFPHLCGASSMSPSPLSAGVQPSGRPSQFPHSRYHYHHHRMHLTTGHHIHSPGTSADVRHVTSSRTGFRVSGVCASDYDQLVAASLPLSPEELVRKPKENAQALFSEFWDIPMNHACNKDFPIMGIGPKNRYQSILPNFHSRVVLPMVNNDLTSTYINANYIHGYAGRENAFIATQGPMSNTVVDFWRMVWFSRSPAIVMITKLIEQRDVKCELYLPNSSSSTTPPLLNPGTVSSSVSPPSLTSTSYSNVSVGSTSSPLATAVGGHHMLSPTDGDSGIVVVPRSRSAQDGSTSTLATPGASHVYGDVSVEVLSLDDESHGFTVRELRLTCHSETRDIRHFWYTAWPDHSSPETTPATAHHLLRLVEVVESCRSQGVLSNIPSGPVVVHCSAGIGRTGCFLALCIGCEQLRTEGSVDVLKIVSQLRLDRGGIVQTNEQYEFIHHALAVYLTTLSTTSEKVGEDKQVKG